MKTSSKNKPTALKPKYSLLKKLPIRFITPINKGRFQSPNEKFNPLTDDI